MTDNSYIAFPSRYAKFVGRIGALAATLGVGVAIATGQGIAVAHAEDNDNDSSNTSDVGSSPDPDSTGESKEPTTPQPPTSTVGSNNSAPTRNSGPTSIPRMKFGNSGGALTSDRSQRRDTPRRRALFEPPHTADQSVVDKTSDDAAPTAVQRAETPKKQRYSAPPQRFTRAVAPAEGEPPRQPAVAKPVAPELGRHALAPAVNRGVDRRHITTADSPATLNATLAPPVTPMAPTRPATTLRPAATLSPATTLLSAVLAPFIHPGPAAPAQPPVLLAVLGWVRREIEHTFFNRVPVVQNQTVTVHAQTPGTFQFAATDDDKLTYSVPARGEPGGPTKGTVTIDQATGSFTYTADPTALDGTPDTFTVTVSDAADGFHLHGLVGLLRPDGGHTDTATVTVNFANQAPIASSPTYTLDVGESTATIDLLSGLASDPDGDPLTRGDLTFNDGRNTIVITPDANVFPTIDTDNAQFRYVTAGDMSTFTITGLKAGTTTLTYTVTDGTDSTTGVITVHVIGSTSPDVYSTDEDTRLDVSAADGVLKNDDVADGSTAELVAGPSNADSFTLNPDGSFTYTPALNTNGDDQFSYRVTDAWGTTNTSTVTIHVASVYDPPEPLTGVDITDDADTPVQIDLADYVSNPDGASMRFLSLGTDTPNGSITFNASDNPLFSGGLSAEFDGTKFDVPDGRDLRHLTFTATQAGDYSLRYTVSDGTTQKEGVLTVHVVDANGSPTAPNQNIDIPQGDGADEPGDGPIRL